MIRTTMTLIVAACAAALAGCSAQLDEARRSAPADSGFDGALQAGYIRLARTELDELDLVDTDAFANRAIMLSRGERVLPERLDGRNLTPEAVESLAHARARLIAALDRSGRERVPGDAAEAQLRFDCWMQEQEENFQTSDISACRSAFMAAIRKVEASMPTLARSRAPALRPRLTAARAAKKTPARKNFTVMFAFDSARLDAPAMSMIGKAVASFTAFGAAMVRIEGHSDRAGTEAYNLKLARERAEAVARAIRGAGVPANLIRVRSYGESRPLVPTRDGQREDKNRRVEIGVDPRLPRTAVRQ